MIRHKRAAERNKQSLQTNNQAMKTFSVYGHLTHVYFCNFISNVYYHVSLNAMFVIYVALVSMSVMYGFIYGLYVEY